MPEQLGIAITAYAKFTTAGVVYQPTPAPTVAVYRYTGTTVTTVIAAATATVAIGASAVNWAYGYTLAALNNNTAGELVFRFTTTDVAADDLVLEASVQVGQTWIEHLDADVSDAGGGLTTAEHDKVMLIGSANSTVLSPVLANGNLRVMQGDSYDGTANTTLVFSDGGAWAAATPTSVTLYAQQQNSPTNLLSIAGVVDWISATKTVTVTLTAANTDLLQFTKHDYQLVARFAGTPTPVQTLAYGTLSADLKNWAAA